MTTPASKRALTITVDVVSDTICPWCFVGKRRMEKAMKAVSDSHKGVNFEVRWHPFFLDPSLPTEGVDKMTSYKAKFGEQRMAQMLPYMQAVGAKEGIAFSYGGKIANTLQSHRLMNFAYSRGGASLQDRVMENVFEAYFTKEANVGSREVLLDAAVKAGMDREEVSSYLSSEAGGNEVMKEAREWMSKHRINGVPFFVVEGKYKLSGAQEPETLVEAFEAALQVLELQRKKEEEKKGQGEGEDAK